MDGLLLAAFRGQSMGTEDFDARSESSRMSHVFDETRPAFSPIDLRMIALGVGSIALVIGLSLALANSTGEMLTRNTVRLSLTWYAVALCFMMRLTPADRRAETTIGRVARWCWTLSLVSFLVHLGMAFHFYHQWSHAHAFQRTAEASGIGEGIYVSYLFTLLWAADVAWWWAQPAGYANRSIWLGRALHTFMLFIVFNGMVIYEQGPIRWAGLAMFAVLAAAWFQSRSTRRSANRWADR